MQDNERWKSRLAEMLRELTAPKTPSLSIQQQEELLELVAVLSQLPLTKVGDISRNLRNSRIAIELIKVENGKDYKYWLIVWQTGAVQVQDSDGNLIDIGITI